MVDNVSVLSLLAHWIFCSVYEVNFIIWAHASQNLQIASWMTVAWITSMTAYLYLYSHGMVFHAASQPVSTAPLSKNLVTVYLVIVASQVGFCDSFAQNMLDHRCVFFCVTDVAH